MTAPAPHFIPKPLAEMADSDFGVGSRVLTGPHGRVIVSKRYGGLWSPPESFGSEGLSLADLRDLYGLATVTYFKPPSVRLPSEFPSVAARCE